MRFLHDFKKSKFLSRMYYFTTGFIVVMMLPQHFALL